MEGGGGSCAICSDIQRLPEECVAHAISLTSPRDACRSEAVSAAFRSAASSDKVWRSFLPSDYAEMLARAVDRVEFGSIKHLYFRPESRFLEVAELLGVWWLDIKGNINSRMLSKWSNYSAYLVFKLSNTASGLSYPLQEASVTVGGHVSGFSVRLMEEEQSSRLRPIFPRPRYMRNFLRRANLPQESLEDLPVEAPNDPNVPDEADEPQHDRWSDPNEQERRDRGMVGKPQTRWDGWMEILLGEFCNEEGDDGDVTMSFSEIKGGNYKSGLIVQGIEIRPNK